MSIIAEGQNLLKRAALAQNPLAKKIYHLMVEKESNLALSCDVTSCIDLLKIARSVGPHISILKTHIDILEDFHPDFILELRKIAKEEKFLLFEDRKFADIGNTVLNQYTKGIYHISSWADMINAHALPGDGVIQGLKKGSLGLERGALILAQMSSKGSFKHPDYITYLERMSIRNSDFVMGFISQEKLFLNPKWIWMTPGIKMEEGGDSLGQSYTHPEKAILEKGNDIIIVGRDIIQNKDPSNRAEKYRKVAWNALMQRS
jgi:uridine monophosphate synthetase